MKKTLIKYPPQAQEHCEYDVISLKRWACETNREARETFRPAAGAYFDGEGWMLNAALAAYQDANILLVEEEQIGVRGTKMLGITIYRSSRELVEIAE